MMHLAVWYASKDWLTQKVHSTETNILNTWKRLIRMVQLLRYAYSYGGNRYYGSSLFNYENATTTSGNYILRVSGYSNFALQPLPTNGAKGNITAIYTKYSSKSGGYIKYQLLVNSMNDIDF